VQCKQKFNHIKHSPRKSVVPVQEHLRVSGIQYAVLVPGMFYQNWIKRTRYRPQSDGSFAITGNAGDCNIPMHDAKDIGTTAAS